MKGVTPVIATILLLLIVISLVGFAFVYFTRIASDVGTAGQTQTQRLLEDQGKQIRIEIASGTTGASTITIRNVGTSTIDVDEILLLVDSAPVVPDWGTTTTIAAGSSASMTLTTDCSGLMVRVSAPGNSDQTTCS